MFNWFSKLFHNGTPNARFFSQFGGMWIDCHDFSERLNMKIQSNRITENEADDIRKFEKNGYIIFQNAIPSADCDRLLNYFEASFASGNDQLIIQAPEEKGGRRRVQKGEQFKEQRIVDVYMIEMRLGKFFSILKLSGFSKFVLRRLRCFFKASVLLRDPTKLCIRIRSSLLPIVPWNLSQVGLLLKMSNWKW